MCYLSYKLLYTETICRWLLFMRPLLLISFPYRSLFIQLNSLHLTSIITCILHFHTRIDYIITLIYEGHTTSGCLTLLPYGIVVEPFPIRNLAADYLLLKHLGLNHMSSNQFFLLSPPSCLDIFHSYTVV